MKIYKKIDFLKLSPGILFFKINGSLCLKGESWPESKDFLYTDLCNIASNNPDQNLDFLQDSLKNGTSYCINQDTSRDGVFNDDLFWVYEEKDIEILISLLNAAKFTSRRYS